MYTVLSDLKMSKKQKLTPFTQKATQKPGIARTHLEQQYKSLPDADEDTVRNGHVLHTYYSASCCASKTVEALKNLNTNVPKYCVDRLVTKLQRFRSLGKEQEYRKFCSWCEEPFLTQVRPKTETRSATDSVCSTTPVLTGKTRQQAEVERSPQCSSCTKLTLQLDSVSLKARQLLRAATERKRKHLNVNKKLNFNTEAQKRRVKKPKSVRELNQTVKRKAIQIKTLREKLEKSDLHHVSLDYKRLQFNHRRLKVYHKEKRFSRDTALHDDDEVDRDLRTIMDQEAALSLKDQRIRDLEAEMTALEERVLELESGTACNKSGKTYPSSTRLLVYDAIVNQVPTASIPKLLLQFSRRFGCSMSEVPHRSTVEMMARELGVLAELQAAEALVANNDVTLGFDSTTQEGQHINSIHFTTATSCYVVAIDELAGGTALDYQQHICESIDSLAELFATIHGQEFQQCRQLMIDHVANTLTDRY